MRKPDYEQLYRLALLKIADDPGAPTKAEQMTARALVEVTTRSWRVEISLPYKKVEVDGKN